MQNISEPLDIGKEKERLEAILDPLAVTCAYQVAGGMSKKAALTQANGWFSGQVWSKVYTPDTARLIAILKQENSELLAEKLGLSKLERLEHHKAMLMEHAHAYRASGEAAHGALYWKAAAVINSMTGDNAPTEIKHTVEITAKQLSEMSESQRTEAYKQMMSGKLTLLDAPPTDSGHSLIDGEFTHIPNGGDTLGDGGET